MVDEDDDTADDDVVREVVVACFIGDSFKDNSMALAMSSISCWLDTTFGSLLIAAGFGAAAEDWNGGFSYY